MALSLGSASVASSARGDPALPALLLPLVVTGTMPAPAGISSHGACPAPTTATARSCCTRASVQLTANFLLSWYSSRPSDEAAAPRKLASRCSTALQTPSRHLRWNTATCWSAGTCTLKMCRQCLLGSCRSRIVTSKAQLRHDKVFEVGKLDAP